MHTAIRVIASVMMIKHEMRPFTNIRHIITNITIKEGERMIHKSKIKVESLFWNGVSFDCQFLKQDVRKGLVVLFPGVDYTCYAPLLHYTRKALLLNGLDVLSLEYGFYYHGLHTNISETILQVFHDTEEIIDQVSLDTYKTIIFVSKSFGSIIAGKMSKKIGNSKIISIFMTPLELAFDDVVQCESLVILGADDKNSILHRKDELDERINIEVDVIPSVKHSLELDNDYLGSIDVLRNIISRIVEYVEERKGPILWKK